MIFVYEKGTSRCFRSNIINVAQERGFYPKEVEKRLATEIEDPANAVLRRAEEREKLDQRDKMALAHYLAAMMKRVPRHRERLKGMIPKVMTEVFDDLHARMEEARESHPEYVRNIDYQLERVRMLQEKYETALPEGFLKKVQEPWPTENMVSALLAMTWRFGISSGPSYFLTSDNPMFFFEGWGIGTESSEIAFALSSTTVLHASLQSGPDLYYMPMNQSLVKEINRRYAFSATRFLFYHAREEWVKKIAQKKRTVEELSRIVWGN